MADPNQTQVPQSQEIPFGGGTIPFYQPQMQSQTPVSPTSSEEVKKTDVPQVIEKIIYKKPRIHGFFRTLTIIALLVVGVLMLLENTGIMKLYIGDFALDQIYPVFIIFSTVVIRSYKGWFGKIFGLILFLGVVGGFFGINTFVALNPSTKSKFGTYVSYLPPTSNTSGIILTKFHLQNLIGNLNIKGTETQNFVEGTYKSDRQLFVYTGAKVNYDYLLLKEDTNRNMLQSFYSHLNLGINKTKTVDIYLKNLLGIHTVDLSFIKWSKAKIHGGIQDLNLILGEVPFLDNELEIQLIGGKITLTVPKNLGVKLYFSQWAGSLELTDFDIKGKDYYESKNISTAKKIVKININAGISKFTLLRK